MTRLATILPALIVIAQLGPDARPVRCWLLDGVTVTATGPGPFWLSRDPALGGMLTWQLVRGGDRDAAARAVGFRNAGECAK